MRQTAIRLGLVLALGGLTFGCDDEGTPDAGPMTDSGPARLCPTSNTPAPEELMGACCWRHSNADQLTTPELRLSYVKITEPVGSALTSSIITTVLNQAMQEETFNWLVRGEASDGDGPVTITTGFGRRQADGTYAFSTGAAEGDPAAWCPAELEGTLTGETLSSSGAAGSITVPVFDETGDTVQLELTLRQIEITSATLSEDRSCIGTKTAQPYTYQPAGTLAGFIEVEPSRTGVISAPGVMTTVCTAIAGPNLAAGADYCDVTDQADWAVQPDSFCDDDGCTAGACDRATECNAWALSADFAASGVDITNGLCGA